MVAQRLIWVGLVAGLFAAPLFAEPPRVLGPGRGYRPSAEQKGTIRVVGSKTLGTLSALWGKGFAEFHPQAVVETKCDGSETALPELAKDAVAIGALSRPVSAEELKELEAKTGRKHLAIDVCEDTLAVIVNKENPLPGLTRSQLRQLFGAPAKSFNRGPATWGEVGLAGAWAARPAAIQVRGGESGSQAFIRGQLLGKEFVERTAETHKTGREMVAAVAAKPEAIGFCRWTYASPEVKIAPLFADGDELPAAWSAAQAGDRRHGLKRRLTFLVPCGANGKPPELAVEFLLYILSKDGQAEVAKDDFDLLDRSALAEQFERLGFDLDK